jgi:hypothetical protein
MNGTPGQVVILRIKASNHGVASGHVSHGQHPRGLDRGQAAGVGEPQQVAVPLRNIMVGPEPRHGGLLRAPHAAVKAAQVLHLVEVLRVFPAAQCRASVWPELRRVLQGQRQYVRHPCSELRRRCGRFIDSRPWWSLDVGHDPIEPVVGPEQEHPDSNFFTKQHAIRFCL